MGIRLQIPKIFLAEEKTTSTEGELGEAGNPSFISSSVALENQSSKKRAGDILGAVCTVADFFETALEKN